MARDWEEASAWSAWVELPLRLLPEVAPALTLLLLRPQPPCTRTRTPSSATAAWPERPEGGEPRTLGCDHAMVDRSSMWTSA